MTSINRDTKKKKSLFICLTSFLINNFYYTVSCNHAFAYKVSK